MGRATHSPARESSQSATSRSSSPATRAPEETQVGLQESLGNQATIGLLANGVLSDAEGRPTRSRHRAKKPGGGRHSRHSGPAVAAEPETDEAEAGETEAAEPAAETEPRAAPPAAASTPGPDEDDDVGHEVKARSKTPGGAGAGTAGPWTRQGDSPSAAARSLGRGSPLPGAVRSRMERGLGQPLDHVRLHDDGAAHRLSSRLDARAVAVGDHVAFAPGQYRPGTLAGDALLAHELAHTVQQKGAREDAADSDRSAAYGDLERDADLAGAEATAALWAPGPRPIARHRPKRSPGLRLSRCPKAGGGATKLTTTANIGSHTKINFILTKKPPKRSNTLDSETDVGNETYKAKVEDDAANNQWKYKLHTIDSPGTMQIVYYTKDHYPAPEPSDDSGKLTNVKKSNWKKIVKELEAKKAGIFDFWASYRAEDVHENYHWVDEWQKDAKHVYPDAEKDMDKLAVSKATAATAAKAEKKLKPQADKIFNKYAVKAATRFNAHGDNPGDPPYKAQVPVVEALIRRVKAYASSKGW